ncbi:hypothetical protein AB1283_26200 [Bacillus sp. S13(2024)]|uniref:hypothetical protein n=1 Tax=Bacillus sp. S13(2024) TaxID=3162885 RepID=UPI003D24C9E4
MLKKINKVLVSVVIVLSLVLFFFSDGTKITVPLGYFNFNKNAQQVKQHSPPNKPNINNSNFSPPTVEQTIKKEKKPVEKSVKELHSEISQEIKGSTMKFKINPKYKIKIGERFTLPKVSNEAKILRLLIP